MLYEDHKLPMSICKVSDIKAGDSFMRPANNGIYTRLCWGSIHFDAIKKTYGCEKVPAYHQGTKSFLTFDVDEIVVPVRL